jgi:hypothetical protein
MVQVWHADLPAELNNYETAARGEPLLQSSTVIFAGALKNALGEERIVQVLWDSRVTHMDTYLEQFGVSVDRLSTSGLPVRVFAAMFQAQNARNWAVCNRGKIFRIYFGHVDQSDEHSFLIP